MFLVSAKVGPFKSIDKPQTVAIDKEVTVLVGMNESGKTVFLQALQKSKDASGIAGFDPVADYPRKDLRSYTKRHGDKPAVAAQLVYELTVDDELFEFQEGTGITVAPGFQFSVSHHYDNTSVMHVDVPERGVLERLFEEPNDLSSDASAALKNVTSVRGIPDALKEVSLTDDDKAFLAKINARIANAKWKSVVSWEVAEWLKNRIPRFLYFGEYDLLPSKTNLADLAKRIEETKANPKHLEPEHQAVRALLRMADVSITEISKPGGVEQLKAKIESVSISLTDQIMEFWKQNEDLEVEIDIRPDPEDKPPYNNGPNLYLRIKNHRHRGVSTPFAQRSRGFIWFFSFLVWFDSVQHQVDATGKSSDRDLILLLDEPGLSLHALAQADFLRYIDGLSKKHQVLYTTHSPFMVHSDRLHQVRVVEDQPKIGTVISDNVSGSDPRTIFPLQAALGWTIAQNLFISERNLLVEGPSDLLYLKTVSSMLEAEGRTGLREDVKIVPTGGLDKVATFVALLGANGLKLAVLHDYRGAPDQKLFDLVKQKMIAPKAVLNASQFRDLSNIGVDGDPTDTEDLFAPSTYLGHFNRAFSRQLGGATLSEADLPPGTRITDRIARHLTTQGIQVRPSGDYNHYTVASHFATNPPAALEADTLARFEAMFKAINGLFDPPASRQD